METITAAQLSTAQELLDFRRSLTNQDEAGLRWLFSHQVDSQPDIRELFAEYRAARRANAEKSEMSEIMARINRAREERIQEWIKRWWEVQELTDADLRAMTKAEAAELIDELRIHD